MRRGRSRLLVMVALAFIVAILSLPTTASGGPGARARGAGGDAPAVTTYRVDGVSTKEQRSAIARTGAGIDFAGPRHVIVRALPFEAEAIARLGFRLSTPRATDDFPGEDARYHNYAEVKSVLEAAETAHPELVREFSIGQSYQGREIRAVKISDNVAVDEDEPEVLYDCLHHAREHLTVETCLFAVRLFADGYGRDPRITDLVNTREIFVVPMVNPDGGEYDVENDYYHYWRKNRQPNPDAIGTDLNRNYDYRWGCCGGSSGFGGSETYRGEAPFDAPEADALATFVDGRDIGGQQISVNLSFHSYGELVLWPYGYTFDNVPPDMTQDDHDVFVALGTKMAQSTCRPSFGCYTPQQSSDLYITDGTSIDWMYGVHRVFAFVFEVYPVGGSGFYPPDEAIGPQTRRLAQAIALAASYADCPYRIIGEQQQYCA